MAQSRVTTRQPWHAPALDIYVSSDKPVASTYEERKNLQVLPTDSKVGVRLPFASNPKLRAKYINHLGQLQFGKFLEDLDACAGHVAYSHCGVSEHDVASGHLTAVTASCDRIDLLAPLSADVDMLMLGCCTYVGRSSMNIEMEVADEHVEPGKARQSYVKASFTFVARGADGKAAAVPQLDVGDARHRHWFETGKARQAARKAFRASSLSLQPPTGEELSVVHKLFMQRDQDSTASLSGTTGLTSTVICHPQNRNIHGKVFGGFLMRHAYELAWMTAEVFSREAPRFVALDDIQFLAPVSVGSIVTFESTVELARGPPSQSMSVAVRATVLDPERNFQQLTNDFHFTFTVDGDLQPIVPSTYRAAMRYIEALRRESRAKQLIRERAETGNALKFFDDCA